MFKAAEYTTESLCMLRKPLLEKAYDLFQQTLRY